MDFPTARAGAEEKNKCLFSYEQKRRVFIVAGWRFTVVNAKPRKNMVGHLLIRIMYDCNKPFE